MEGIHLGMRPRYLDSCPHRLLSKPPGSLRDELACLLRQTTRGAFSPKVRNQGPRSPVQPYFFDPILVPFPWDEQSTVLSGAVCSLPYIS